MNDEKEEVSPGGFEVVKAVLGADAETFRRTKLGQYIYDRVERQEQELIEELIELALKSSDPVVMRRATSIQMHRMLPKFIDEAIQTGHSARENLQQMESNQQDY